MDVKEFLQSIPAFEHLSEAEFERLAKLAKVRQVKAGVTTDAQGATADKFYILVHGRVAVVLSLDFGVSSSEYMVTTIGPGAMFAWSGMVGNPKYTASGKTLTECTVLEFDVVALEREFEQDAQLGFLVMRAVARTIASRLRKMQLQVVKQHAIRESVE